MIRKYGAYPLTNEQNAAVDLSLTGEDVKIEAYAGAGKTSTLSVIARELSPKRGLYIAFNAEIVKEAKNGKFPKNTECRTGHSLAWQAIISKGGYSHKIGFKCKTRLTGYLVASKLGLSNYTIAKNKVLLPPTVGYLLMAFVEKYCNTGDAKITIEHAPYRRIMDYVSDFEVAKVVAQDLIPSAEKLYKAMSDKHNDMPMSHGVYLKMWQLSKPDLSRYDFILFDEAQDANGVMLDIVMRQKAQKIFVGDRFQQIYSWRGAVNAMTEIKTTHHCKITQSFRFGQPVADIANAVLNGFINAGVNIRGFDKMDTLIEPIERPDAILCRTNSAVMQKALESLGGGLRVHVVGNAWQLVNMLKGVDNLQKGEPVPHISELAAFNNWDEVVEHSENANDAEIGLLVKLVSSYNVKMLISQMTEVAKTKEDEADIVVSTAHKAKGREWDSVTLADDFECPEESDMAISPEMERLIRETESESMNPDILHDDLVRMQANQTTHYDYDKKEDQKKSSFNPEMANLLYVAVTRAQKRLDITGCTAVHVALKYKQKDCIL